MRDQSQDVLHQSKTVAGGPTQTAQSTSGWRHHCHLRRHQFRSSLCHSALPREKLLPLGQPREPILLARLLSNNEWMPLLDPSGFLIRDSLRRLLLRSPYIAGQLLPVVGSGLRLLDAHCLPFAQLERRGPLLEAEEAGCEWHQPVLGNKRLHVSTRTGNDFAWDTQPEYRAGVAKQPAKKKTAANLNRQKLPLVPRVRKPGEKQSKYANGTRLRIFWDGDGVWYMGQAFHGPGFQHVPRAGFLGSKTAIMPSRHGETKF